jgi:hypothetical protein
LEKLDGGLAICKACCVPERTAQRTAFDFIRSKSAVIISIIGNDFQCLHALGRPVDCKRTVLPDTGESKQLRSKPISCYWNRVLTLALQVYGRFLCAVHLMDKNLGRIRLVLALLIKSVAVLMGYRR